MAESFVSRRVVVLEDKAPAIRHRALRRHDTEGWVTGKLWSQEPKYRGGVAGGGGGGHFDAAMGNSGLFFFASQHRSSIEGRMTIG